LTYPDFKLPFVVQTDASNTALGAVIGQYRVVNGVRKFFPIMYGSRHLTSAESRWSATERELLAITWANKRFAPYVFGRHVTYVTDHRPLVTLKELKEPAGRLGRLFNHIQDADYSLVYQPGVLNYTADMLSRPEMVKEVNAMEMAIGCSINWVVEQQADEEVKSVFDIVDKAENLLIGEEEEEACWNGLGCGDWVKIKTKLVVLNQILMVEDDDGKLKIVVPAKMVSTLLKFKHDMPLAGHRDFERTYESIKSRYFWHKMHRDVKEYCSTCHLCQTKKYLTKSNKAPMKSIVVNTPWSLVGLAAKMNENLVEARRKQKMYYDQNVKDSVSFEVREWVLVVNERNKTGESKSFKQRALGPFEVLEVFNDVNYRIKSVESGKEYVVHYNRLRKYKCRFGMEAKMEQKVSRKKVKNVAGVVVPAQEKQLVETVAYAPHFWTLVALGKEVLAEVGGDGPVVVGGEAEGIESEEGDVSGNEELRLSVLEQEEAEAALDVVADVLVQEEVVQQVVAHDEEVEEGVGLVQCGELVMGLVCTKMCKPAGLAIHQSKHRRDAEKVAVEARAAATESAGAAVSGFFSYFNSGSS